MPHSGLLAFLAPRLTDRQEDLATEALTWVCRKSPGAQDVIESMFALLGLPNPGPLIFQSQRTSQEAGDSSRPDIAGIQVDGRLALLLEAKFWADLTQNQPGAYLDQLGPEGLLLFIAPRSRLPLLWQVLMENCSGLGLLVSEANVAGSIRWTAVADGPRLAVIDWMSLLGMIQGALSERDDKRVFSAIEDLADLCASIEDSSFAPIFREELVKPTPSRVRQFLRIIEPITREAERLGYCAVGALRPGGSPDRYGRFVWMRGIGIWIGVDYLRWTLTGTPHSLEIAGPDWKSGAQYLPLLQSLQHRGLIVSEPGQKPAVRLPMPLGVEEPEVISLVVAAVAEVDACLAQGLPTPHLPANPVVVP